ncbi:MAG: DUF1549 and DUF1553 domain-containing protein [Planctomycetota bacterium]|nr:DUF1549 and DUF1553 domain-containing protein [Planctomycetota bacterium]
MNFHYSRRHLLATLLLLASTDRCFANEDEAPSFVNDIVPLLTKLSCNSGGCHGKATGQNGFKLSLLGFEPHFDYTAVVKEARGRRVFPGDPDRSLLLQKAVGRVPHGGGKRLDQDSDDYRLLQRWIVAGATAPRPDEPVIKSLDVLPQQAVLDRDSSHQLRVVANFSNGRSRDVTRRAVYESNADEIADIDKQGRIHTHRRSGLFAVMVRFGGQIGVFRGTVPFQTTAAVVSHTLAAKSDVDRTLIAQWQRLRIQPSPIVDDFTFLRRATLDICGTLPTVDEVTQFVADKRPDKRPRLIDRLLERPEYASYFALKWADVLQNRGRGYSTSKQRRGTALFSAWIRDSLAENKPYDQFVAEMITATGSQQENPPAVWYRSVRTTQDYVESIAQAFLGVRIQCAQCHHHPAERWSQADYYGLAAVFARVGRKGGFSDAEVPTNEILFLKRTGEVRHPRTNRVVPPRPLGGPDFELAAFDDPRRALADWMTAKDNPFFARTLVNRLWGHFMGRGIIEPIDDARSTNPPSNPELLDALAKDFVAHGFDVQHLIRRITNSHAYGLSSIPTESNRDDTQSFARFYPRRLSAEVLLDGMSQVLAVPTVFPGGPGEFPKGTRAIDLPDENVPVNFLDVFGRPARTSACECERSDAPALAQALELVNSSEIQRKLSAKDGFVEALTSNTDTPTQKVNEIFLRVFARNPTPAEAKIAIDFVTSNKGQREAFESLIWSLLATNEFLFNH